MRPVLLIAVVCGLMACEQRSADASNELPSDDAYQEPLKTRYVLVIGVDGVRPDALIQADTPRIDDLIDNGLFTSAATTQLASVTSSAPGWMSILTGVGPDKHQVWLNGVYLTRNDEYKTFLWQAHHTAGLSTMASVTWGELLDEIIEEDACDEGTIDSDEGTTIRMETDLVEKNHRVIFIHLDDVDHAGHSTGFAADNADYIDAIEVVDGQVGRMLDAIEARPSRAEEEWLVGMTTDHGGEDTTHGDWNDACRTIWLLLSGDLIQAAEIPADDTTPVSHMDIFPSVMEYLGIEMESNWGIDGVSRLEWME